MTDRPTAELREGALTFARISELDDRPVIGQFDAAHLKEVHRRIFQDLPHHAPGEYRPEAPAHIKGRALEHSGYRYYVHYAPRAQVEAGVEKVLSELGGPTGLRGLNAEQFSARLAKLYGDLDYLHPFQEGNSRTLRAFTSQLAREVGLELDWGATNADALSRDRLYIARDKEVIQRAFPGLDETRAMTTENRAEYEAYMRVLMPFQKADTLQTLIQDSVYRAKDLAAAQAFREGPSADALQKHPDLAGSFAQLAAIERKAEAGGSTELQRYAAVARAREVLAMDIERGERPIARLTVEAEHGRPRTPEDKVRNAQDWDRVLDQMRRRNAPAAELDPARVLRASAHLDVHRDPEAKERLRATVDSRRFHESERIAAARAFQELPREVALGSFPGLKRFYDTADNIRRTAERFPEDQRQVHIDGLLSRLPARIEKQYTPTPERNLVRGKFPDRER
jgi:cell filamentation protein